MAGYVGIVVARTIVSPAHRRRVCRGRQRIADRQIHLSRLVVRGTGRAGLLDRRVVLTVRSFRELPLLLAPRQVSDQPDRFAEAQLAYLTGNYALAEEALTAGLSIEPRDPPALLLLAAVLRHTGRLNAADALLTEIPKLEAAAAWNLEWESERARLERDIDSRGELQDNAESEHEPPENAEETNASPSPAASAEESKTETTEPNPTAVAEDSDNGEANMDDAEESEPATLSIDTTLRSFSSGEDDDLDNERPNSGYSEAA